MDGKMLWCGDGLEVPGIVALKTGHESHADTRGQVWVFAVGFLSTPPAWIPEDVDVRRPDGQPTIPICRSIRVQIGVVLSPELRADGVSHLVDEGCVEGCSQSDGLREDRRRSRARHPVQA